MATQQPALAKADFQVRGRPARRRVRTGSFRWQTVFIIALLCLWEAFPLALIGIHPLISYQIFAAIVFAGVPIYFVRAAMKRISPTFWDIIPLALVFVCTSISIYYSGVLKPQPLLQWLPAIYTVSPILMLFILKAFGAEMRDGENALYISGILASILVFVNGLGNLHLLDYYVRGSGFGTENRVVFFKLESTFALMIGLMRLVYARRMSNFVGAAFACFFTFYNVFVLSESRLAIAAILLGAFLTWLFIMRAGQKLFFLLTGPILAIPLVAYVIEKYMRNSSNMSSYLKNDLSAVFRNIEIDHYAKYFQDTGQIGFGFMSGNPAYDNIISYSANRAGAKYGVPGYPLSLDDIGLYSSLYQYGYLGLLLCMSMTFLVVWKLGWVGRLGNEYASIGAIGMLMLAFLFSPISMNYFTIFYTAHMGGILWFIAATAPPVRLFGKRGRTRKSTQGSLGKAVG